MNTKMQMTALEILRPFIISELEDMGSDWWTKLVCPFLSQRQQLRAWGMGPSYISQVDFSEALWVLRRNWELISDRHEISPRYEEVLIHLQNARNAFAHSYKEVDDAWLAYDQNALDLFLSMIEGLQGEAAA